MAQTPSARLAVMRDLVRELEQRVGSGEVPPEGLESFKAAIDDIRLRLWALLAGAQSPRVTALPRCSGLASAGPPTCVAQ